MSNDDYHKKPLTRVSTEECAVPTVHLNGSDGEGLYDKLAFARNSVQAAMEDLNPTAPHPRDYYPQEIGSYTKAQAQFQSRMERLSSVHIELDNLSYDVYDAWNPAVKRKMAKMSNQNNKENGFQQQTGVHNVGNVHISSVESGKFSLGIEYDLLSNVSIGLSRVELEEVVRMLNRALVYKKGM